MIRLSSLSAMLLPVAVAFGCLALGPTALAESFDKPLRETVLDLGPSQYLRPTSESHVRLFCSYYSAFMTKQLKDPGVKGTLWVTIVPILKGNLPTCRRSHDPAERFIAKGWWSFIGLKGSLLFLEAADGSTGGMPFRVLDLKTRKQIFEDSKWGNENFEFVQTPDGKMSLRYLRLVEGQCSIPRDGAGCWSKFSQRYGLPIETVPKCSGYRVLGEKEWAAGDEGVPPADLDDPSAIVYPVEVNLSNRPSIQTVPGPVECFPTE